MNDNKAMRRDEIFDHIDLIPSWAFWRDGCYTFAKNVTTVLERAGEDDTESSLLSFIRFLPLNRSYLAKPEWQAGFCSQCLEKAYINTPDADKELFRNTVMEYFLYYFPDRSLHTQAMLVDAFVGCITGIAEAVEHIKEAKNGRQDSA